MKGVRLWLGILSLFLIGFAVINNISSSRAYDLGYEYLTNIFASFAKNTSFFKDVGDILRAPKEIWFSPNILTMVRRIYELGIDIVGLPSELFKFVKNSVLIVLNIIATFLTPVFETIT